MARRADATARPFIKSRSVVSVPRAESHCYSARLKGTTVATIGIDGSHVGENEYRPGLKQDGSQGRLTHGVYHRCVVRPYRLGKRASFAHSTWANGFEIKVSNVCVSSRLHARHCVRKCRSRFRGRHTTNNRDFLAYESFIFLTEGKGE
jgi:hypothetical protein